MNALRSFELYFNNSSYFRDDLLLQILHSYHFYESKSAMGKPLIHHNFTNSVAYNKSSSAVSRKVTKTNTDSVTYHYSNTKKNLVPFSGIRRKNCYITVHKSEVLFAEERRFIDAFCDRIACQRKEILSLS